MPEEPSDPPAPPSRPRRARALLVAAVLVWAAVVLALANVRLLELQLTTWDFGIYQQALWTAAHGAPFYESADYETGGYGSFLQVHSAVVLYLLAPLYGAWPSPELLLGLQTAVVALAALPLFLLIRSLGGSVRRAGFGALLFLVWAPTVAGALYDVHIESLLPLEMFALAFLLHRRRYGLATAVTGVSFLTMEFAPVLTFVIAAFFGWPTRAQVATVVGSLGAGPRRWGALLRKVWNDVRLRSSAMLAVGSAIAYYLLLAFRTTWLARLFGFPAYPSTSSGYTVGATPGALGFSLSNIALSPVQRIGLWFLLYALVGFAPLLLPRSLVLSLPLALYTTFTAVTNYSSIGFQYGFVFAPPVFIGLAFALPRLSADRAPWLYRWRAPRPGPPRRRRWRLAAPPPWTVLVAVVVVANVLVGPIDPWTHGSDSPGSAYRFTYSIPPGYDYAKSVAALVPPGDTVVATDDLFPLVADSFHAYTFYWGPGDNALYWPFSPTNLPQAVLISQARYDAVTPWIAALLYNSTEYDSRAVAWSTPEGMVLLFVLDYQGPVAEFGAPPPVPVTYAPSSTFVGPAGRLLPAPWGPEPSMVENEASASGLFFSGPWGELAQGRYSLTLGMHAWPASPGVAPSPAASAAFLNGQGFATPELLSQAVPYSAIDNGTWTNITVEVTLDGPICEFEVHAYTDAPGILVAVGYLTIAAD